MVESESYLGTGTLACMDIDMVIAKTACCAQHFTILNLHDR